MSNQPSPCPWCGSSDIAPALIRGFPFQSHCRNCGAEGPFKFTAREADTAWNTRQSPPTKPLTCDDCGEASSDVQNTECPYAKEMRDETVAVTLCKFCYKERLMNI